MRCSFLWSGRTFKRSFHNQRPTFGLPILSVGSLKHVGHHGRLLLLNACCVLASAPVYFSPLCSQRPYTNCHQWRALLNQFLYVCSANTHPCRLCTPPDATQRTCHASPSNIEVTRDDQRSDSMCCKRLACTLFATT